MPSMRPNRVKHKLAAGELATGVMGTGMTADLIEWLGPLGFDSVWLEGEHGPLDYRDIPDQSRAADLWGMTSIVRVNENRYGPIYRVLDLGAQGVCVPHVDTRDQAQAVADASKFYPVGQARHDHLGARATVRLRLPTSGPTTSAWPSSSSRTSWP